MPAPEFNPHWFQHPGLPFAWRHPDGWALYPNGETHSWPDDITPVGAGDGWIGYEGRVSYRPWPGFIPDSTLKVGGKVYYHHLLGYAVNSKGHVSIVGQPISGPEGGATGLFGVWSLVERDANTQQNRWLVVAMPLPGGFGGLALPWWHGKTYPEWPPLRRGRPRRPPD